jgi:NAD(P)-dependent dehydrogenase (short-subunit alcohol dehydrogenase family)
VQAGIKVWNERSHNWAGQGTAAEPGTITRGVNEVNARTALSGVIAVVTGASSGIGARTAEHLLAAGAVVAGLDLRVSPPSLRELRGFFGYELDVADPDAVAAAAQRVRDEHGPCGVLVNCAGVLVTGRVGDTTLADWDRVMHVNVRGTWLVTRAFLPQLAEDGGVVVTVASGTGLRPIEGLAGYAASKAALISLARSIAIEYLEDGVRSVCVCPGPVDTPMSRQREPIVDVSPQWVDTRPPIEPDEIARVIVDLCSPGSPSLTGAVLAIDGGRTLH